MLTLLMVFTAVSYGQGLWYNWSSNGHQSCHSVTSGCWTPWSNSSASCYAPNVGPGGWRLVGGGIRVYSGCIDDGHGEAEIKNNLPSNYYLDWDGFTYTDYGGLSHLYDAWSSCDTTTDGSGNIASAYNIWEEDYGCD